MEPLVMEMPQNIQDEATYISENFGVAFPVALETAMANAEKAAKSKKKKRVSR